MGRVEPGAVKKKVEYLVGAHGVDQHGKYLLLVGIDAVAQAVGADAARMVGECTDDAGLAAQGFEHFGAAAGRHDAGEHAKLPARGQR